MSILIILFVVISSCGSDKTPATDTTANTPSAIEKNNKEEVQTQTIPTEHIAKAKEILEGISPMDLIGIKAKDKYNTLCSACHGIDGKLNLGGASDLSLSSNSITEDVAQIYFGKGTMPPFKNIISEAEIIAIAMYLDVAFEE